MNGDTLLSLIKNHRGKVAGILLGLLFGILVLYVGLWYSLFLFICALIGYIFGGIHDRGERLASFLDKIMSMRLK